MEALPTRTETSWEVVRAMMDLIISQGGLSILVGSDNGSTFKGQGTQGLSKALGLVWKLYTASLLTSEFRPGRKTKLDSREHPGKILPRNRNKLGHNASCCTPKIMGHPYQDEFTPFELMFGRPPPLVPALKELQEIGTLYLHQQMKALH